GALSQITEMFGQTKLVKLQFAEDICSENLSVFGEVTRCDGPVVDLKVERANLPHVLEAILSRYTVLDMNVQDPPLDQVIARVFQEGAARHEAESKEAERQSA